LALNDDERDPLVGHLDRVRVTQLVRSEATSNAGGHRQMAQGGPSGGCRPGPPGRRPTHNTEQSADGHRQAHLEPLVEMLPPPGVHADLATAAALPSADEDAATSRVEVALRERQRLVDPQPRAPEQHDQRSGVQSRRSIAGAASPPRSPRRSADRPVSSGPCCVTSGPNESRTWSPATDDDQQHRETQNRSSVQHPAAGAQPPSMERGTDTADTTGGG
jgi:hypothetical protein